MTRSKTILKNSSGRVSKKNADEHLQDVRHKNHNSIRYRKRMQEEHEIEEYLKQELQRLSEEEDDSLPEVP